MPSHDCELCQAVTRARTGQNLHLIHDFGENLLVVGSHQTFAGYCMLVHHAHVREPFELTAPAQQTMLADLMTSARALQTAFAPWKINYGSYGNQVPHLHWHLFPRYESDPQLKQVPWMQSAKFDRHRTTEAQAKAVADRIQAALRHQ